MVNELGASTQDTLKALTTTGARLCGFHNLGTLVAGNIADIISVEGNPLEDIGCLANVGLVLKDGKRYDRMLDLMLEASAEFESL